MVRYFHYSVGSGSTLKKVGAFEVLGKGWDSTLGGLAFDRVIVEHLAAEFDAQWGGGNGNGNGGSVLDSPRACTKLRLQATKVKEVLSANSNVPIYIESLHDGVDFKSSLSREKFEELCGGAGLLDRAVGPIADALRMANVTVEELADIEMIGGGMRVPKVQERIRKQVLGGRKELGMHINSDESMALGAAFRGANVSNAFRVRKVGMSEINVFPVGVRLEEMELEEEEEEISGNGGKGGGILGGLFGKKEKKVEEKEKEKEKKEAEKEEKDVKKETETETDTEGQQQQQLQQPWSRQIAIFPSLGKVGKTKKIAFTQSSDVTVSIAYEDFPLLPPGSERSLANYNVTGVAKFAREMREKGLEGKPRVSMQFKLDESGISSLVWASASVEEEYTEEVEVTYETEEYEEEEEEEQVDEVVEEEEEEEEQEEKKVDTSAEEEEEEEKKDDEDEDEDESEEEDENEDEDDEQLETNSKPKAKAKAAAPKNEKKKKKNLNLKKKKPRERKKKTATKTETQTKTKVHKATLTLTPFSTTVTPAYTSGIMEHSRAKLRKLALRDRERAELEESRNKCEAYIYSVKARVGDDAAEEVLEVSTEEQRAVVLALAGEQQEWMDDEGYDAGIEAFDARYAELSGLAEVVFSRAEEATLRPRVVTLIKERMDKMRTLMGKWETTMPQVNETERSLVFERIETVEKDLEGKLEEQGGREKWEEPAFKASDLATLTKQVDALVTKLSKKPKPKPPKKEKEKAKNETETNSNSTVGEEVEVEVEVEVEGGGEGEGEGVEEGEEKAENAENENENEL